MLHNCKPTIRGDVLKKMDESKECDFFLTGSRFFGSQRVGSDWDFFTEENEHVDKILTELGFYKIDPSLGGKSNSLVSFQFPDYGDTWMRYLYYHKEARIHVQVILRGKAQWKQLIQAIFLRNNNFRPAEREWSQMMVLIDTLLSIFKH